MSLPKLSTPTYQVKLPTSGKTYKFRPFLAREQKLLLMALESKDKEQMKQAMRDIINVCFFEKVNVDSLASFELEYLFVKLRAKSVGETADLAFKCEQIVKKPILNEDMTPTGETKEEECGGIIEVSVNLDDIELDMSRSKSNRIVIGESETGEIGIVMQYPTYEIAERYDGVSEQNVERLMNFIVDCVESVYEGETVYTSKDMDKQELVEFVESIPLDKFQELMEYLSSLPVLSKQIDLTCPKCKYHTKYTVEGLDGFFG